MRQLTRSTDRAATTGPYNGDEQARGAPGTRRLPDGTFDVVLPRGAHLRLPERLGVLLLTLAADTRSNRPVDRPRDGLVAFKNAGHLIAALETIDHRLVRRRRLATYLHELRRRLDRACPGAGAFVQTKRGIGWRLALLPCADTRRRPATTGDRA